jgi:uncharacterized protein YndB with AHSA1/START domain
MRDGTIERNGHQVVFRYERQLAHTLERVWTALTEPVEIAQWTGSRPELELRPGGKYVTHHGNAVRVVDHVLRVEPPTLFEHTFWAEINPSAQVCWQLRGASQGCLLTLTHAISDDDIQTAAENAAPADHPAVIMSRNAAGWHRLLDRIECFLDQHTGSWSPDDQAQLQHHYATKLSVNELAQPTSRQDITERPSPPGTG